jgi:flagellar FliL protein
MAEQADSIAELDPAEDATAFEAAGPVSGRKSKLVVALIVVSVIVAECAVAYLVLPSVEETALMAGVVVEQQAEARAEQIAEETADDAPLEVEVTLGKFSLSVFQSVSRSTRLVDFELFGLIREEDKSEFDELLKENEKRFREQVMVIIRSAAEDDLTDSHWGLLKNQILDKSNRLFGKPILRSVHFSEFSLVEQ